MEEDGFLDDDYVDDDDLYDYERLDAEPVYAENSLLRPKMGVLRKKMMMKQRM